MNWFFGSLRSLQSRGGLGGYEERLKPPSYPIPLKAYPALYLGREDLEYGNKVLLPPSILNNLSNYSLPHPMMFSLKNMALGNSTNVGVLEFTAQNGVCILPNWLFEQLHLDYGAEVYLQLLLGAPQGRFIKLQPHRTEFIELPDPKVILERNLSSFVCVTQGDTISVQVLNKGYLFDILEVKPKSQTNCICLIEADIEVDFAPPLDYKEKLPGLVKRVSDVNLDDEEEREEKGLFCGKGIKINGQVVDPAQEPRKKISDDVYDPRKHRIPKGIRPSKETSQFIGLGIKIGENKSPLSCSKVEESENTFQVQENEKGGKKGNAFEASHTSLNEIEKSLGVNPYKRQY